MATEHLRSRRHLHSWLTLGVSILVIVFVFGMIQNAAYTPTSHVMRKHSNATFESRLPIFESSPSNISIPTIYIITPTYTRVTQMADLTRMLQTLSLVHNIHWIIVEDAETKTGLVERLINKARFPVTHLNKRTPTEYKTHHAPRGVFQRNEALTWLRNQTCVEGVVYFADDDNTYDIDLFEEIRFTHIVSVWPVGLLSPLYETPVVKNGKVVAWISGYSSNRKFLVDMAGFAINARLFIEKPDVKFQFKQGHLEDNLLRQFNFELSDFEPKAANCTKVLVWHTRTEKRYFSSKAYLAAKYGKGFVNVDV